MSVFVFRRAETEHAAAATGEGTSAEVNAAAPAEAPPQPGPYANSDEHLRDELRRIDQLVHAQTQRWRLSGAAHKTTQAWDIPQVSANEIEAYLQAEFVSLEELPPDWQAALAPYWNAAHALAREIEARLAQTDPHIELRLVNLQRWFGLSNLECDVVLIALLPEVDSRYRRLFGCFLDDLTRTRPTVELTEQILYPFLPDAAAGRALFAADAALAKHHILLDWPEGESLALHVLQLDVRIVSYLLGSRAIDDRLHNVAQLTMPDSAWKQLIMEPDRLQRLTALPDWYRRSNVSAGLFFHGPTGSGRSLTARAICTALQLPLLEIDVPAARLSSLGWAQLINSVYREARLQQAAVLWRNCDLLIDAEAATADWRNVLQAADDYAGLSFFTAHAAWPHLDQLRHASYLRIDFPPPGYDLRRQLWTSFLPPDADFARPPADRNKLIDLLANGFQLTAGQMQSAIDTARRLATLRDPRAPQLIVDDVYEGCRRQSSQGLAAFARRIVPHADLDFKALILPEASRQQIDELRQRIGLRSRVYNGLGFERRLTLGRGLIALFTGSSGTGKTMAASLLAREHGVDLYRIDPSTIVSKYVGETEKNLKRVFAEAEGTNAILFFDEADALFSRRSEVKDAQDRYANLETNYLLQAIEDYEGVVILASNLRQNIDEAFLRRIQVHVDFPFPDKFARRDIWRGMFPDGLEHPKDQLHLLADRFELPGGSVKNIVVDAAFRALAEAGEAAPVVTVRHLVDATAREYQKLGKPITKGEFGDEYYDWVMTDLKLLA